MSLTGEEIIILIGLLVILPLTIGSLALTIPRQAEHDEKTHSRIKYSLVLMPLFWTVAGINGAIGGLSHSELAGICNAIILNLFFIYGLILIILNKGRRFHTILFLIINTFPALFIWIYSAMAISDIAL